MYRNGIDGQELVLVHQHVLQLPELEVLDVLQFRLRMRATLSEVLFTLVCRSDRRSSSICSSCTGYHRFVIIINIIIVIAIVTPRGARAHMPRKVAHELHHHRQVVFISVPRSPSMRIKQQVSCQQLKQNTSETPHVGCSIIILS